MALGIALFSVITGSLAEWFGSQQQEQPDLHAYSGENDHLFRTMPITLSGSWRSRGSGTTLATKSYR
jgi:hypothetical protein